MVTTIIALRHAKPKSEGYAEDAIRPLSEEGIEVQKKITKKLQDEGYKPTQILTSPLLRAQQTAQIATDLFAVPFEDEPALGDDFDKGTILARIPPPENNATLFLVGHAPTLGDLINQLVGDNVLPNGLSKSTAAIVTFDGEVEFGNATFVDYLKP